MATTPSTTTPRTDRKRSTWRWAAPARSRSTASAIRSTRTRWCGSVRERSARSTRATKASACWPSGASRASRTRCRSSRSSERQTRWLTGTARPSGRESAPQALLGLEDGRGLGADGLPQDRVRLLGLARCLGRGGDGGPRFGGGSRERGLLVAGLLEEARVHEPEIAAAGSPALDHLVQEPGAPARVLRILRPGADLGGKTAKRGQPLKVAQLRLQHACCTAGDRLGGGGSQLLE